jgi:hypothetical protein
MEDHPVTIRLRRRVHRDTKNALLSRIAPIPMEAQHRASPAASTQAALAFGSTRQSVDSRQ